ncbi:MAG: hypothetical protein KBD07_00065 [Candidatus Omnitrophica bacterium]|nr:hypothetical protein [Candidatus Omnitrophota bacterium]
MKRAAWVLLAGLFIAAAGLTTNAFSQETDLSSLKKEIAKLIQGQQTILAELKSIKDELYIIKIRSSR